MAIDASTRAATPGVADRPVCEASGEGLSAAVEVFQTTRFGGIVLLRTRLVSFLVSEGGVEPLSACCRGKLAQGHRRARGDRSGQREACCGKCGQRTTLAWLDGDVWLWREVRDRLGQLFSLDPLTAVVETAELWACLEAAQNCLRGESP